MDRILIQTLELKYLFFFSNLATAISYINTEAFINIKKASDENRNAISRADRISQEVQG